ncbi:hypothetical protein M011DRAFT_480271 [Sporormia fimetaria CBS 119925]|uniref:Uncharacterized protein n=1 Tax=Sporormia fimetaria CBS 119925 TaxID=1340428 RepID=A0A6A6V0A4_9PLEO|nr:hypothetical protein M011DRAFT_480271 [Sporormia fimetaria CBS 119925]
MTTTQTVSSLSVPHADAMELQSDTAEDVDLDLTSTYSKPDGEDEDVSIHDATIDDASDLQRTADDDFMVDKEDAIDEDEIDYDDDVELEDVGQSHDPELSTVEDSKTRTPHAEVTPAPELRNSTPLDDDLIDYSDDDEEPLATGALNQESESHSENPATEAIGSVPNGQDPEGEQPLHDGAAGPDLYEEDATAQNDSTEAISVHEQQDLQDDGASRESGNDAVDQNDDYETGDATYDAALEPATAQPHQDFEAQAVQEPESSTNQGAAVHVGSTAEQTSLHPVSVAYYGSELWLFKPRHSAVDGEWLLEDDSSSLAAMPLHSLFGALRNQLGDELGEGTEIGLRFDDFYAWEVFEDCMACACLSLKELVDFYLALHLQDGETDPEPMHITLTFRPRVMQLVLQLKEAVKQGWGFTGLAKEVEEGRVVFNAFSGEDTYEPLEEYQEEYEEGGEDEYPENEINSDVAEADQFEVQTTDLEPNTAATQPQPVASEDVVSESKNEENAEGTKESPQNGDAGSVSAAGARLAEQDDYIDYTDDEEDEATPHSTHISTRDVSTGTSTLQEEQDSHVPEVTDDQTNETEPYDGLDQVDYDFGDENEDYGEADHYGGYEQDASFASDTNQVGFEEDAMFAGDTNEAGYEQDASFADDTNEAGYEHEHENQDYDDPSANGKEYIGYDAGQDYYDNGVGASAEQNTLSVAAGTGYVGQSHGEGIDAKVDFQPTGDSVTDIDDSVDVDADQAETTSYEYKDEIDYDDDEEDVPEQTKETQSSVASVAVPPLAGAAGPGSPQGQKRRHHGVDGDVLGADESIEAKRIKL